MVIKMKKENILFNIGYIITCFIVLSGGSKIFELPDGIKILLYLITFIILGIDFLMSKPSIKKILFFLMFLLIGVLGYIRTGAFFLLLDVFVLFNLKDKNLNDIIKIDFSMKLIFIIIHCICYSFEYSFNYDVLSDSFMYKDDIEGGIIRHSMMFLHPNTFSSIFLWMVIDIIYLNYNKNEKLLITTIICSILMVAQYLLTKSRTALIIYFIYIVGVFILKKINPEKIRKILDFIYHHLFDIIFIATVLMCILYLDGNYLMKKINGLTSGRIYSSSFLLDNYGISLLPVEISRPSWLIIDNFYILFLCEYGFIYLIFLSIVTKVKTKEYKLLEKFLIIILFINLFSEYNGIIVGNSMALILLFHMFWNNRKLKSKCKS